MQRDRTANAERLLQDVGWAMRRGLGPRDLIPMLKRLVANAPRGSDAWCFGMRELAKLQCGTKPWAAARLARELLSEAEDAEASSTLGLALSMLGHFRAAERAYRHSLAIDPGCPSTLHNYGHLVDVGLGQSGRALVYLQRAHAEAPNDEEIAGSLALCLARAGRRAEAEALLESHVQRGDPASVLLDRWLASLG